MHFKIWILAKENVRFMPPNKRNKKKEPIHSISTNTNKNDTMQKCKKMELKARAHSNIKMNKINFFYFHFVELNNYTYATNK